MCWEPIATAGTAVVLELIADVVSFCCRVLSSVKHVQLLKFNTMQSAFGNFTREADYMKFAKRMNQMGSVWCCIDAHPGHIHYDFWWDTPHIDKFGRQWDKWEPTAGP